MKKFSFLSALVGAATGAMLASPAMSDTWQFAGGGGEVRAYVYSVNKATSIAIGCDRTGLYFDLYFMQGLAGWQSSADVAIAVDQQRYPVLALDGASDFVRLHTRPDGKDGVSTELLEAMAAGNTVSIEGAAAARMRAALRSYSLNGSAAAIADIRSRC